MSRKERWAWVLLLVLAAVLRLWALGERPPHHDEAVHGNFGHILLTQGAYRYDPTYHGPLLFYVMVPLFAVLGETDFVARLYPALAGIALVGLPFFLRRRLGRGTAWWTGLLVAISPAFLYYSRFARNDVPVVLFTAVALSLVLLVRRHGGRLLPWAGVAMALHAISKETIYVYGVLISAGAGVVALREGLVESAHRTVAWLRHHRLLLATAGLWFLVISLTAYTFFFIHPEDAFFPGKAISYWYNQHKIQRVGGPWFYHLPRLALYEALPIVAATVWMLRRRGRAGKIEVFCYSLGVASVGMFAYLGEKVPWLEVHQVYPFLPLAGAQLARTFSRRGRWWSRSLAGLGIAATAWSALASSFIHPALTTSNPHGELIVFVQTTPEANALARRGVELARREQQGAGEAAATPRPIAAVSGEASWPLSWQWSGLPVQWSLPSGPQTPPLVVCDPSEEERVQAMVGEGYRLRRMPLRAWWVEEYRGVPVTRMLKWFVTRRTWSPIGATEVTVLESESQ